MKATLKPKRLTTPLLINGLMIVALLIYTIFQPNISLHYTIMLIMSFLIIVFIINLLFWAWLDNKESETRRKALLDSCKALEENFKDLLIKQDFRIMIQNHYMKVYGSIIDEALD
ncbi:hypothetical protein D0T84_09940 [Dysgonomonas sp. 521]|uniref:hypothetical protein n=1 Tax=Dysgonomonas sp. 521 TaxID=2302932 RepID=UPI0013D12076|nr:hypothetical protein [Dysgonomonas sp. 521]NDV95240.1 hypothetical protein [Dysgonomonas sp. 521]